MNQKISTGLGTAILLVMAFTAGYFIWVIERPVSQPKSSFQIPVVAGPVVKEDVKEKKEDVPVTPQKLSTKGDQIQKEIGTIHFNGRTAYIKIDGLKNSVVLMENGMETVVDEAEIHHENRANMYSSREFSNLTFSPKGNYLMYADDAFENRSTRIYDIKNKRRVDVSLYGDGQDHLPFADHVIFTKDENYIVACASSGFSGDFYGKVMRVPNFTSIYDVYEDGSIPASDYLSLDCKLDDEKMIVRYELSCHRSSSRCPDNNMKSVEYDINSKKSETL